MMLVALVRMSGGQNSSHRCDAGPVASADCLDCAISVCARRTLDLIVYTIASDATVRFRGCRREEVGHPHWLTYFAVDFVAAIEEASRGRASERFLDAVR